MGNFHKIRFSLFVESYASYLLKKSLSESEQANSGINKLAKVLLFKKKQLNCFILHKTCKRKFNYLTKYGLKKDESISIYLQIEKELCFLVREKKRSDIVDDYERALLAPAIERVAGNNIRNIRNDHEFEKRLDELKRRYRNLYYTIAYHYKLPTLRILPYILRLISVLKIV